MPAYPLTFPAVHPARVIPQIVAAQQVDRSPGALKPVVYDWGGRMFRVTIEMQTMDRTHAELMGKFLQDLDGQIGTFLFDLTPWCPGWVPAPGVHTFILSTPETPAMEYRIGMEGERWSLVFAAEEWIA